MKKCIPILFLLLLSSLNSIAQTLSNDNFIYTAAPQRAVKAENYNSLAPSDLKQNITYFDGLGRPIQSVAIKQGGIDRINNNLLDWKNTWTIGNGSVSFFNQNGDTAENVRINGVGPFDKNAVLWQCVNDAASDADGGWNSATIPVDKTASYRYAVWVKRIGGQDGYTYHGTQNVVNLDGSPNGNPYFWAGILPSLDTWYLMVGMIHPASYTGGYSGISGVYDTAGNKVISGTDFKWSSTTVDAYFRSYLYYATNTNTSQYFYNPTVQKIDGSEASISGLASDSDASDIVTHMGYDGFGRQDKDYLPYAATTNGGSYKADALTATNSFYNTPKYENTINPFSQKQFEASPLNRVLQQGAPGNDWKLGNGHEIKLDYQTNVASEVKQYTVSLSLTNNTYTPTLSLSAADGGFYGANELFKTVTKDENWIPTDLSNKTTEEFKNKEDQVILKRTYSDYKDINGNVTANKVAHDTYYIYDIYGNLTYVLPPKAEGLTDILILNNLCYQYIYDSRNRLIEKKLPGKQWEFIVYDKLDRVVATGPAFSPFSDLTTLGWLITKYDAFSRPVYTGWMTATVTTSAGRKTLQDEQNSATVLYESKQASGIIDGIPAYYTNAIAPTLFKLLTVNYYDNYTFPNVPTIPTTVETQTVLTTAQVKSLATGSWTRALTGSAAILGETAATFYDVKARPIRSYSQNYLGGYTYADSKLDFTGMPQYSITYHKRLSTDTELKTTEAFTYSPQGRILTQTHQINSEVAQLLASNTYDELGQLISKKVGNTPATPIQKVDYTYNIRGWLTDINNTSALQQGTDPKDLFAFKINYNTSTTGVTGVKPLYNGNIAETFWNTASDPLAPIRAYGYQYDNLNRLENAVYKKDGTITNAYNESMAYDKNGNILTLLRNGNSDVTATEIDNLAYTYTTASNQLDKVTDTSNNPSGFKDGTNSDNDFTYDTNGNMVTDKNKNITAIVYNHLNLPTKITSSGGFTFGSIQYIYNARGQKLEKNVSQGTMTLRGSNISVTNYLDGFQYLKAYNTYVTPKGGYFLMKFFPTAEGYVEPSGSSYKYVYQYKDHLGNVRLSYDNTLTIQEENNYYPFGLKQAGYNIVKNSTSDALKYKYQGQERQDELGLNWDSFKWRNYDYAIGRFMSIDPLAEEYAYNSTYAFQENKLGLGRELEGLELVYREGTNPEFKEKFAKTVKFMNERGTSGQLNQLNEMSKTILIDNTGNGSFYRGSTDELFWDPTMAVETTNNKILSPATVLGHEIDHALDDKKNPTEHTENSKKGSDTKYDTKEEKRVIQGSEQITARKHGDIKAGEVTRTDHQGKNIRNAPDPTSNKNTTIRPTKPIELPEMIIRKSK